MHAFLSLSQFSVFSRYYIADVEREKTANNDDYIIRLYLMLERAFGVLQVGAALSMVYVSGVPVMFVGCGQTYTDLKKLNVKSLVKSLLV